ncbi:OLC1v1021949C1 [Oldenlandia corymbosa var. corymbosa]|uniref:OLC1v1021949C1 n=1 Tax=Oldenlandia corymbosa var. corymbosa TaxID=529605 RepID=A0AAV1BZ26_OLDCO|nr:OLC1v1021949C1 [Oldenlandia corymbosa var. corymbosa]
MNLGSETLGRFLFLKAATQTCTNLVKGLPEGSHILYKGYPHTKMIVAIVRVQNLPANESAMKAPNNGVRLAVPEKLVRVLAALVIGIFISLVKYVIMFARNPAAANFSHISLAALSIKADS